MGQMDGIINNISPIHPTGFTFYLSPPLISYAPVGARQLLNQGMIATGSHHIEKFAALCNALSGEAGTIQRTLHQTLDARRPSSVSPDGLPASPRGKPRANSPFTVSLKRGGESGSWGAGGGGGDGNRARRPAFRRPGRPAPRRRSGYLSPGGRCFQAGGCRTG